VVEKVGEGRPARRRPAKDIGIKMTFHESLPVDHTGHQISRCRLLCGPKAEASKAKRAGYGSPKTAEAIGSEEVPDQSQNDHAGEDARDPNEKGSHLTFAPLFAS